MNFGKWIVLSFVLFALFIGTLVWLCVREDISLVSKDYYKEELEYQKQIERQQNTLQLQQQPNVKLINQSLEVEIAKIESGNLKLFCPSNSKMDREFNLSSSNSQTVDVSSLQKGKYIVKLSWQSEGKEFYYEQEIFIG